MSRARPREGWQSLELDELQDELEARGLGKRGAKDELVARLDEDDAGGGEQSAGGAAVGEPPVEQAAGEAAVGEPPVEEAAAAQPELEQAAAEQPEQRRWRQRGSAETGPAAARGAAARPDGRVVVRARARYVRSAPRKARLVMDHIRGKPVEQARAILDHTPRAVSADVLKLLNSALANAESNYELGPDELRVRRAFVDEGPTIKRYRPRALGRATRINKRTSHMTIELTTER